MSKNIIVIGSCNTDMVIKADRLPVPGETVMGGSFMMNPGGKGANQAVAAARLKGNVYFIAKTGNDLFGKRSIEQYEDEGIHVEFRPYPPFRSSTDYGRRERRKQYRCRLRSQWLTES